MGVITVRKLSEDVVARLKERARAAGRSMEEEARLILSATVMAAPKLTGQAAADHFHHRRKEIFGDRVFDGLAELIRDARDEDPRASPADTGQR